MAEIGYRTLVAIPMDSADPANAVVNQWHMRRTGLSTESIVVDEWHDALQTFYGNFSALLSALVDHTLVRFKTYDLEDPKPRVPVLDEFRTITAPTAGAALPAECSMVLSYRAQFQSGINPASLRGRAFIGPLKLSTIEDAGNSTKFTAAARDTLANAADLFLAASTGNSNWRWSTYSPTRDASLSISNSMADVIAGHVDNAVDIQRRRGVLSTARSLFS